MATFRRRTSAVLLCLAPLAQVIGCAADANVVQDERCSPATVAEYAIAQTTADSMATVSESIGEQLTEACTRIAEIGNSALSQLALQDPIEGLVYACGLAREKLEQLAFAGTKARVNPSHCVASDETETCRSDCEPGSEERCRNLCTALAQVQFVCDASVVTLANSGSSAATLLTDLGVVANSYYEVDFVMDAASKLNDVLLELDRETFGCGSDEDWRSRVDESTSLLHSALIVSGQIIETVTP